MTQIDLHPFTPADRDWTVAVHIETYEQGEGFDATFGRTVAQILDDFSANQDFACERGWVAWRGDARLGTIFCMRLNEQTAKLRLFQLVAQARGHGLGRCLLEECTGFARAKGYREMQLATHKSHEAAVALYQRNGWQVTEEKPVVAYGLPLVEQTMRLKL
ncbi:GNAT family N-acetyltransferase [Sulfitobacter sp. F26169L]|uniref:GNAT family N-acetyltransferase n=1 Tax=Sulfitobacter sp. F26169L TaxID=2996015 RepID=UPI0022609E3D|nr:GNAT family N-acetyltransferase [Sulfitobacter sp. F26169L]MCX7566411.1 GNAT family N-acetyltransferase [Sulfitobacter sp. F26169L]